MSRFPAPWEAANILGQGLVGASGSTEASGAGLRATTENRRPPGIRALRSQGAVAHPPPN